MEDKKLLGSGLIAQRLRKSQSIASSAARLIADNLPFPFLAQLRTTLIQIPSNKSAAGRTKLLNLIQAENAFPFLYSYMLLPYEFPLLCQRIWTSCLLIHV